MKDQNYAACIESFGFISTVCLNGRRRISEKKNSSEDYVGKITAVFLPYIQSNIPDGKFFSLQNEVKKIVCEIKEDGK